MFTKKVFTILTASLFIFISCGRDGDQPLNQLDVPTRLDAEVGDGEIEVSWKKVPDARYKVYYGTESGEYDGDDADEGDSPIKVKTNHITLSGLKNDREYFIAVSAINSDGETALSKEISATPKDGGGNTGTAHLSVDPPSTLSFSCDEGSDADPIDITIRNTGTDSLEWEYDTSLSGSAQITLDPSSGSIPAESQRTVEVSASNCSSLSGGTYSGELMIFADADGSPKKIDISITVSDADDTPRPPSWVDANPGDRAILVTWESVPQAQSYRVYRGTSSGVYLSYISTSQTSYTYTGLTNGISYFIAVKSYNSNGLSTNYSPEVTATPHSGVGTYHILPIHDGDLDKDGHVNNDSYLRAGGGFDINHKLSKTYLKFDIASYNIYNISNARIYLDIIDSSSAIATWPELLIYKINDYGNLNSSDWDLDFGGVFFGMEDPQTGEIYYDVPIYLLDSGINCFMIVSELNNGRFYRMASSSYYSSNSRPRLILTLP